MSVTLAYSRVVDCAHPVSESMPHWPGDPRTAFAECATLERDGYRLRSFAMSEHAGTHCNAPNTFFAAGADIAAVLSPPPVLPVVMADFSGPASACPDVLFGPDDLFRWEETYGTVPQGSLFCLHTGWGRLWSDPDAFWGLDRSGSDVMRFPAFSPQVAELLVHERGVAGMGIDTHGVDAPSDTRFAVNRCLLDAGRLVLECLANLHELPPAGSTAVIGGLRLRGGTGCPVSVTVLVP